MQDEHTTAALGRKHKKYWRLLLPVGGMLLLGGVLYAVFGRELAMLLRDPQVFKARLDSYGAWSEVCFVAIRTVQTVFKCIPAEPLEVASGYAFGVWGGLLWCMVGTQIGSWIILLLTKRFGKRFIARMTDADLEDRFSFLRNQKKMRPLLFLIYLIPGAPKDLLTYFVAFTDLKIAEFLVITSIARIPSIITSTMCGAYFGEKNYIAAVLIYAITILLSLAGVWAYRRLSRTPAAQT